ncbi:MAG: hypothetical protein JSU03_05010 [Bacteroidetes bacterium]|nr:hypothetical protein [Bacteroidota bacterium]
MKNKEIPQPGVVYQCCKGFTDYIGDFCRKGQKFVVNVNFFKNDINEEEDYYLMEKASGYGMSIMVECKLFSKHFVEVSSKPPTAQCKFKKGDKVKVLVSGGKYKHSFKKNSIIEVDSVNYDDEIKSCNVLCVGGVNRRFQLIPENELVRFVENEFKSKDKVIILTDEECVFRKDSICEVIEKIKDSDDLYILNGINEKTGAVEQQTIAGTEFRLATPNDIDAYNFNYFKFEKTQELNTHSFNEGPIIVGVRLAPLGLEYRCLAVSPQYSADVIENNGKQIIRFKMK